MGGGGGERDVGGNGFPRALSKEVLAISVELTLQRQNQRKVSDQANEAIQDADDDKAENGGEDDDMGVDIEDQGNINEGSSPKPTSSSHPQSAGKNNHHNHNDHSDDNEEHLIKKKLRIKRVRVLKKPAEEAEMSPRLSQFVLSPQPSSTPLPEPGE